MDEQKNEMYAIIGAAMEVHNVIGCGFPEKVYQDAFEQELLLRGIPYQRELHLPIVYKGVTLVHDFYADFVCYGNIIVELKSTKDNEDVFEAQCINYLKASNFDWAVLINFGQISLYYNKIKNFMN